MVTHLRLVKPSLESLLAARGKALRELGKAVAVSKARAGQRYGLSPAVYAAVCLGWKVEV